MSWTKRQFVEQAFEEIGYAAYTYDLQTEQLQAALRRLDALMATWNSRGIKLGYPLPSTPDASDLDEVTGVPDKANEAVYLNLAIRIAPIVGKMVSAETKASAKSAYGEVIRDAAKPSEMQLPTTMPAGAGNKPWRRTDNEFLRPVDDGVVLPPAEEVNFNG